MLDSFKRKITYLRVSVTDRCNLRCTYCMPEEGISLIPRNEILSFEELTEVIKVGTELGITKIRLTGGEPLVREGIAELVKMIKMIRGIEEVVMTTNGVLLETLSEPLKRTGLDRVNVSLDTLDPDKYRMITRGGSIEDVKSGIFAALRAGLTPVKINFVKMKSGLNRDEQAVRDFCLEYGLELRLIRQMVLETGEFSVVEGGAGGNCPVCNRLRLMANGDIKPCLFSNTAYNVKEHGIKEAFLLALNNKPKRGNQVQNHKFYNIGG